MTTRNSRLFGAALTLLIAAGLAGCSDKTVAPGPFADPIFVTETGYHAATSGKPCGREVGFKATNLTSVTLKNVQVYATLCEGAVSGSVQIGDLPAHASKIGIVRIGGQSCPEICTDFALWGSHD